MPIASWTFQRRDCKTYNTPLPCKKYFFALAKQADVKYFEGDFVVGVYKSIMQGLQEDVAYTEGRCPEAIIHIIPGRNLEERESTPLPYCDDSHQM